MTVEARKTIEEEKEGDKWETGRGSEHDPRNPYIIYNIC